MPDQRSAEQLMSLSGVVAAGRFDNSGAAVEFAGDVDGASADAVAMICAANSAMGALQLPRLGEVHRRRPVRRPVRVRARRRQTRGRRRRRSRCLRRCRGSWFTALSGQEWSPDLEDRDAPARHAAAVTRTPGAEFLSAGWMAAYRDAWNADEFLRRSLRTFSATVRYAVSDGPCHRWSW